jgi:hypothetical protein
MTPGALYSGMIMPYVNYSIMGALWCKSAACICGLPCDLRVRVLHTTCCG